jgi:hypothetical protein
MTGRSGRGQRADRTPLRGFGIVGLRRDADASRDRDLRGAASEVASPRLGDRLGMGGDGVVRDGPERRHPERLMWTAEVRPG